MANARTPSRTAVSTRSRKGRAAGGRTMIGGISSMTEPVYRIRLFGPAYQPVVGSSRRQLAPASALRYNVPTRPVSELLGNATSKFSRCSFDAWQSR